MPEPIVTLVVVPRERFSCALRSLDSIYADTDFPFRLIYVDGGSPRHVRTALQHRARERGFELIRVNRYLTPNQARNLGLRQVRTRYAVLVDNDVVVTPGWLGALVGCAEETGAALCGPVQLIGEPAAETIHLAGGNSRVVETGGRRKFQDAHHFSGARLSAVRHQLKRQACELVEFHCVLMRMELFPRLGPFDERLLNTQEYADFCLLLRAAGLGVFVEPGSVVTYVPPPPFAASDLPYFLWRWSEQATTASLDHFVAKWRLDREDPGLDSTVNFARWHRRLPWRHAWSVCDRAVGGRLEPFKKWSAVAERVLTQSIVRCTRLLQRDTRT